MERLAVTIPIPAAEAVGYAHDCADPGDGIVSIRLAKSVRLIAYPGPLRRLADELDAAGEPRAASKIRKAVAA